jgi:hypothetical protein
LFTVGTSIVRRSESKGGYPERILKAGLMAGKTAYAMASAVKGKGQRQTGIEVEVILTLTVLITERGIKFIQ